MMFEKLVNVSATQRVSRTTMLDDYLGHRSRLDSARSMASVPQPETDVIEVYAPWTMFPGFLDC